MAKYDAQFKLQLVQEYLTGAAGHKSIAARHGIRPDALHLWIKLYQQHGQAGLERKHTSYSAQFKLEVVERMRREHLSCKRIAALYNIRNPSSIRVWQTLYEAGGIEALAPRPKGRAAAMRKFTKLNRPGFCRQSRASYFLSNRSPYE